MIQEDKFKFYTHDLAYLIKQKALEAKENNNNLQASNKDDYSLGYLMAFHDILSLMKQQANAFNIEHQEIGLDDIEPEHLL